MCDGTGSNAEETNDPGESNMDPIIATCGKCKARQDVTVEVRKVRDALAPNTFGAYTWKCRVCGFLNQGMVDAPP